MGKKAVFALTFLCYSQIHGFRTMWAYMSKSLQNESYSKEQIGQANLIFLFTYGVCMNIRYHRIGPLACKYSQIHSIGIGSMLTGLIAVILAYLDYVNQFSFFYVALLMVINGLVQSTPYPGCIGVIGNWFEKNKIGFIMGIWQGCTNSGDIFALIVGDIIIERLHKEPYYGFLVIGAILIASGLLVELFLNAVPNQKVTTELDSPLINDSVEVEVRAKPNINILTAWLVPGVLNYALIYGCLKGTFYGFMMWLPYFFQTKGLEAHSSWISQMFDIGTFLGGVLIGFLGDKYLKRVIFIQPSLLVSMALMLVVRYVLQDLPLPYYLLLFSIGVFLGGPYNNISGVIGIELGKTVDGDKSAISTLTSLIESFGTITAAVFQVVIPYLGQEGLFVFFCCVAGAGSLLCIPLLINEFK